MFIDEISRFLQPKACAPGCSSLNYLFGDDEKNRTKTSQVVATSRPHLKVCTPCPKMLDLPGPNPKQRPFPGPPSYSRWSLFVSTTLLVFQRSPWHITAEGHHGRNAPFLPPLFFCSKFYPNQCHLFFFCEMPISDGLDELARMKCPFNPIATRASIPICNASTLHTPKKWMFKYSKPANHGSINAPFFEHVWAI